MEKLLPWLVGIDEAGRGALAGPVAVGGVVVSHDFDFSIFTNVADSKQLSPQMRELVFKEVVRAQKRGDLCYHVALISEKVIDKKGIVFAVRKGVALVLQKLEVEPNLCEIRLDGSLYAPPEYLYQKTIIKGDVTEPAISLASIMAKVTRDRKMVALAQKYPAYAFDVHKGYGTSVHCDRIEREGLSGIHRRSFCRRFSSR